MSARKVTPTLGGQRHLGRGGDQAAVGEVVHDAAASPAWIRPRTKSPARRSSARSTGGGAPSSRPEHFAQVEAGAELAVRLADQHQGVAGLQALKPARRA